MKKFFQNSQKGFVFIPALIFVLSAVVVGGAIGITQIIEIDRKIKEKDTQLFNEFGQLYRVNLESRSLKEKTINYSRLGIELPELATVAATVRTEILGKNFTKALNLLDFFDKKLEEAVRIKREADKASTILARDNLETKLVEFKKKGVNVSEVDNKLPEVRSLIDSGEYAKAREEIEKLSQRLEQLLIVKEEQERKEREKRAAASVTASQNVSGINYSKKTISTVRGNFTVDVLTVNLDKTQVVTDTANSENCYNNCPTKPLSQYVAERGGVAGINGTYFCPPDYASCSQKIASYDFPVYNTILGKFLNADKLFWSGRAMMAFDVGNKPHFFREANTFGGINIKAAIVNYPALVDNGQIVVDEGSLSANLGQIKGNRGALGFLGNTLFAVIGHGATVSDMAYVMQSLGALYAMNLDGGGSSAMFFAGSYKVGPGRNLPNAIVFVP